MTIYEQGSRLLPEPKPAGALILDFPDSMTVRDNFQLLTHNPVHDIFYNSLN